MKKQALKFDPEDARLTAYALGELAEEERGAVEALLEQSAEAREFVTELRATAERLAEELAGEELPSLSGAQHAALAGRIGQPAVRGGWFRRHGWRYAAAAVLTVSVVGFTLVLTRPERFSGMLVGTAASREAARAYEYAPSESPVLGDELPSSRYGNEQVIVARLEQETEEPLTRLPSLGYTDGSEAPARARSGEARQALRPGALQQLEDKGDAGRSVFQDDDDGYVQDLEAEVDRSEQHDTEAYDSLPENPFRRAATEPLSTFSIDVDTASYANVRRMLTAGQMPPPGAVRIEEFVNYFAYDYPLPGGDVPFSVFTEVASCPWKPAHRIVHIGLRTRDIPVGQRAPSNLVFLLDVSGSMDSPDKLPLLKRSMRLLVDQLDSRDRVAIVVYAGASGLALPSTSVSSRAAILAALDGLDAGGSTNGGEGIELAYRVATENLVDGGVNRVILCTDGDFNVGVTSQDELVRLIETKRETGVFLSVLGFGTGNFKDSTAEKLADEGNGNYAYIDSLLEARKVLVSEMGGTLVTVAKDVKIQVEFNPAEVQAWRLIGYENRVLAHEDFNDDTKDAGEIGAGLTVTALYEIVPRGVPFEGPGVDPLKYQEQPRPSGQAYSGELLELALRYKQPEGTESRLLETPVRDSATPWPAASDDFKFSAAVAAFAMRLRGSAHLGEMSLIQIQKLAAESRGDDPGGYRQELLRLIGLAEQLR